MIQDERIHHPSTLCGYATPCQIGMQNDHESPVTGGGERALKSTERGVGIGCSFSRDKEEAKEGMRFFFFNFEF